MLDDDAPGAVELGGEAPGRVEVQDVVEGELLALDLAGGGHRVEGGAEIAVEGRLLVRVLAVAEVLHFLEGEGEAVGKGVVGLRRHVVAFLDLDLGEVGGDGRLVSGAVAKSLLCKEEPRRSIDAVLAIELLQEKRVVERIGDDGHVAEVLRGTAEHGGSPDIDVLHRLVEGSPLRHLVFERVEIHHHDVDGNDLLLLDRLEVRRLVTAGQDAAVHDRMQGLDPSVEDLGEAGGRRDFRHRNAGVGESLGRSTSREELETTGHEPATQFDDPVLAVDGDESSLLRHSSVLPQGPVGPASWGLTSVGRGIRVRSPCASRQTASHVAAMPVTARE